MALAAAMDSTPRSAALRVTPRRAASSAASANQSRLWFAAVDSAFIVGSSGDGGSSDTAREIATELFPEQAAAGERILVVGGARGFSRRMVEDSVSMAERLGYGIVALTVSPAMEKLVARLRQAGAK